MSVDQTTFRRAVLDPGARRPVGLSDGIGQSAGRRFDVYRNNVAVSLTEALETGFPVIRKLLGADNFRILAGIFLRQHPPASPLMMQYGAEMPAFLETFEHTASLPYLPDIARLELSLRESYHAADADPIDPARLQAIPTDTLMSMTVTLAPSLRLVRSSWPIHAIWRFNTDEGAPKPRMAAEDVVILRSDLDPSPHALPPGGAAFIAALMSGAQFGAAVDSATAADPTFDLAATLAILLGGGGLVEIGEDR